MTLFEERLRIDGKRADARIEHHTTAAKLTRTMEGAASLELTVSDPGGALLRSGVLSQPGESKRDKLTQASWSRFGRARLTLDGAFFRLAGVSGQYDEDAQQLTLTFEDEIWSLLRRHKGPMKAKRPNKDGGAGVTRAQFIARMVREVHPRPTYVIPELSEDQPIRGNLPEQRRRRREKGFERGARLTIKGARADSDQKRNLETALTIADEEKAGERATLALIVGMIQESGVRNLPYGDRDSQGILQLRVGLHGLEKARSVEKSVRGFLVDGYWGKGGAIDLAADNPSQPPGWIAQQTQGSGHPDAYDPWLEEAGRILEAWGGSGRVRIVSSRFEYRRLGGRRGEQDETSTECIRRLTDDVRWRAWADENVFHLVTDPWLFQNRPITTLRPDTPGVAGVSFTADVGIPVAEIKVKARTRRWAGSPGDCVALDEYGGLDGRWLSWELVHDLFTGDTDITLRRPKPPLPEPAPDRERQTLTEPARLERGSMPQRIIEAAEKALKRKDEFIYSMTGGQMETMWQRNPPLRTTAGLRFDCSRFVTLCFKAAGAPDPNGANYRGASYTGSLVANGTKTTDPTPGDTLVFFGANPGAAGGSSHVGLYVGGGKMIENHGPTGGHGLDRSPVGSPTFYMKYDMG